MEQKLKIEVVGMLREYAENRWFTGENKVEELKKKQDEELAENWAVEMKHGEQNDKESELYFKINEMKEERDVLFQRYSKKYHEIHDLIKKIEGR